MSISCGRLRHSITTSAITLVSIARCPPKRGVPPRRYRASVPAGAASGARRTRQCGRRGSAARQCGCVGRGGGNICRVSSRSHGVGARRARHPAESKAALAKAAAWCHARTAMDLENPSLLYDCIEAYGLTGRNAELATLVTAPVHARPDDIALLGQVGLAAALAGDRTMAAGFAARIEHSVRPVATAAWRGGCAAASPRRSPTAPRPSTSCAKHLLAARRGLSASTCTATRPSPRCEGTSRSSSSGAHRLMLAAGLFRAHQLECRPVPGIANSDRARTSACARRNASALLCGCDSSSQYA